MRNRQSLAVGLNVLVAALVIGKCACPDIEEEYRYIVCRFGLRS